MRRLNIILLVFLAVFAVLTIYQQYQEPSLLNATAQFRKLVACSDTQLAQTCWQKYGQAILQLEESNLSKMAHQIVQTCLQNAETQHLHDLEFLLSVQKCFHLGQLIDLRPTVHSVPPTTKSATIFDMWLRWSHSVIVIYLVLNLPNRVASRIWRALNFVSNSFEALVSCLSSGCSTFISFLCAAIEILRISLKRIDNQPESPTEGQIVTLEKTSDGRRRQGTELDTSAVIVEGRNQQVDDPESETRGTRNVSIGSVKQDREAKNELKRTRNMMHGCVCEVTNSNVCGEQCDDEHRNIRPANANRSEEQDFTTPVRTASRSVEVQLLPGRRMTNSNTSASQAGFAAHVITTASDIGLVHSRIPSNSQNSCMRRQPKEAKVSVNNENVSPTILHDAKPSFNISTESGRGKMKAYIEAKMGRKVPLASSKTIGAEYRELSRVDSENLKMRRVFVAKKGWVWLSRNDTNGVQHLTENGCLG